MESGDMEDGVLSIAPPSFSLQVKKGAHAFYLKLITNSNPSFVCEKMKDVHKSIMKETA